MTIEASQAAGASDMGSDSSVENSSSGVDSTSPDTVESSQQQTSDSQPAFTPNYQFKVYDKSLEFPEWIRPLVTDKTREDEIRDIFSKAYGIDGIKSKYERSKQELAELSPYRDRFTQAQEQMQKLIALRDNDLGSFIEGLGLSEEQLMDYLTERARLKSDPAFAQEYNRQRDIRQKLLQSQEQSSQSSRQLEQLTTQNQELQRQMHQFQLEQTMSRQDVNSFASQFDSRMGQGSFTQAVIDYGNFVFHTEGRNISPVEAVNAVMQKYQPLFGSVGSAVPNPAQTPGNVQTPPTIPNVGTGKGVSPTKPRFKSIEDIKKHYEQEYGS